MALSGPVLCGDGLISVGPLPSTRTGNKGSPVIRSPKQLHLHPALDGIGLPGTVAELNRAALSAAQSAAFEPLLTTTAGVVLAGFGLWQLAVIEGRSHINCIEYPLDDEQALLFMLSQHQARNGWNAFVRTEVALKLEPSFQREALAHMQAGGKYKGSAMLPEARQIDVREKVAEAAGVCARNVSKVKEILKNAHPRLIEAVRDGVLSINRAAKLCTLAKKQQADALIRDICHRGTSKVIQQAISRAETEADKNVDTISVLDALQRLEEKQPGSVEVRLSRSRRTVIVVGQGFLDGPLVQKELSSL